MSKYQTKRSEGFTIIEVLIVLAIAGLIMLVVFLAVPNLQRNSRNNSYRNEASNILGAYSEVSSNKNGAALTAGTSATDSTPDSDAEKVKAAANPQNITTVVIEAHVAAANITANTAAGANQVSTTKAIIRTGAKCAGPADGTATAGTSRQVALYFAVETPGGLELQCQSS